MSEGGKWSRVGAEEGVAGESHSGKMQSSTHLKEVVSHASVGQKARRRGSQDLRLGARHGYGLQKGQCSWS